MAGPETPKGPDAPDIDLPSVEAEKQKWMQFQERFVREWGDHELTEPLLRLHSNAMQHFDRIERLMIKNDLPGSYEECWRRYEEQKDMYAHAIDLRARILEDYNRESIGLNPGEDLTQGLIVRTEQLGFADPVRKQLLPIVKDIGVDPLDIPEEGSRFFEKGENGILRADIPEIRKAKKELQNLARAVPEGPQKEFMQRIEEMLNRMEGISPIDREILDAMAEKNTSNINAWGIVRKIGIVVAGVYTLFSALNKNWKTSAVSGVILAFLIRPDILRGKDRNAVDQIATLMRPESKEFLEARLDAPGSSAAVQEVFDRTDGKLGDPKAMKELISLRTIDAADLDRLFGSEPTPMKTMILRASPADRPRLVQTLAKIRSAESRALLSEIVKSDFEEVQSEEEVTAQLEQEQLS